MMDHDDRLTTAAIHDIFADEIAALGGAVTDRLDDGDRLFARAVLDRTREVLADDRVHDGVAVAATGGRARIYPYIFRLVCRNGAIIAQAGRGGRVVDTTALGAGEAEVEIREAVRGCGDEDRFATFAEAMREAGAMPVDPVATLMPLIARLPDGVMARQLLDILERYTRGEDPSQFGLMNAVTATARDTTDPDMRWRLEEFGGSILVGRPVPPGSSGDRVWRSAGSQAALV